MDSAEQHLAAVKQFCKLVGAVLGHFGVSVQVEKSYFHSARQRQNGKFGFVALYIHFKNILHFSSVKRRRFRAVNHCISNFSLCQMFVCAE